jgi:hypothetical protein
MLALLTFELKSQSFFERITHRGKRRKRFVLDSQASIAGVGGEIPCHIFGRCQVDRTEHHALEIFGQELSTLIGHFSRLLHGPPKFRLVGGEARGFELHLTIFHVAADQKKIAVVRNEHLAILTPVFRYLLSISG